MIQECSINYELKLAETVELPGSNLFIGEIVAAYTDTKSLSGQIPDVLKTEPLILVVSPTSHYYDLGSQIADAFKIGKDLT
jgi:flavin reductase (DIM6/NTAB) family NADH-FMN oxidoreductase RutF